MLTRSSALHLLAYDRWANTRLGSALAALPAPLPTATRLFAHVVGASELWLARVENTDTTHLAVWPEFPTAALTLERSDAVSSRWTLLLSTATTADLTRAITFHNSKNEPCSDPLEAIVTHLANHGTHHRAQIASLLRAAGANPPSLDYIVWRRAGSPGATTPPANTPTRWKHFVIESTYLVPLDQLDTLLAAHRSHLAQAFDRGLLLASGPQSPRTGGMILARAKDKAEIDALLAADPFQKAGYSRYRVIEFQPVKYSSVFETWSSADATH